MLDKHILKMNTIAGKIIDIRSLHNWVARTPQSIVSLIVSQKENNIGPLVGDCCRHSAD
jgi:hypothetical protein